MADVQLMKIGEEVIETNPGIRHRAARAHLILAFPRR